MSEEITPSDWAALIARTADSLDRAQGRGIVIGHGTDTLSYTAGLLYWFFADATIPVVLTASTSPTDDGPTGEAAVNLRTAVGVAAGGEKGIHVVFGRTDYFAVNLKFERAGAVDPPAPGGDAGGRFRNWNGEELHRSGRAVARSARNLSQSALERALEVAIGRTHIVKVYPGLRGETLIALMDAGIRYFVLEIFDTGTANLRESPFSLRKAFSQGREKGVQFFCTSQQEGVVDFSEYVTAHQLWREGAVPMGGLTTEAVWTRLIAAQIEAALGGGDYGDVDGEAIDALLNASVDGHYTERVLALMED